ncbi:yiaA/B two helix domain containing protein [Acanthamoeba castellanii str. Neff]|uniref:YiaA/B two helix domain containing protein n=1 Tax=Acanthamoeba castellanii (strain ATCC 30010 / Neff) TaxID=1257118 RepID=L8H428_ACACF|nr:yiaA/B two helix domain containing protein [Acanthamoeba castellanii str. Neff]ELR19473.1 yiaA/B two helix domain containing protein [Acanthamoeba castellanii str. Neff]
MASVERSTNLYTLGKETAHMAGWEESAKRWGMMSPLVLSCLRKAFLGMGFTFMTASAFTLAKTMRDLQEANSVKHLVDAGIIKTQGGPEVGETIVSSIGGSAGWVLHSWLAFGASISLTAWGLLNLPIADERKVFLATSGLLLLTSTMNLVKAVRDRIDARRLSALLEDKQHLQEKGKERDREMDEVIEIDRSTSSLETF